MEVGMKAFVSFIRGFKEHHCKYIFRAQVRMAVFWGGGCLSHNLGKLQCMSCHIRLS
jgi:hypothetical protein